MAAEAKPGQFLSLYTRDGRQAASPPHHICEIDRENGRIRLVYRVTGKNTGTEAFSRLHAGVPVEVLGPLGNGFPLHEAEGKRVFLMGGGIGIPPMLQTAKELNGTKTADLGYRDELFLNDEFQAYADVCVATEDGSTAQGKCYGCHQRECSGSRCDFCLRTHTYASGNQSLCGGKKYSMLDFYGRTYGLRRWGLSCLCVQIKGDRQPFPCTQ